MPRTPTHPRHYAAAHSPASAVPSESSLGRKGAPNNRGLPPHDPERTVRRRPFLQSRSDAKTPEKPHLYSNRTHENTRPRPNCIGIKQQNIPEKPHLWLESPPRESPCGHPHLPPEKPHLFQNHRKYIAISITCRKHIAYHFKLTGPEKPHLKDRLKSGHVESLPRCKLPKNLTIKKSALANLVSPNKLGGAFPVSNRKLSPEKPHLSRFLRSNWFLKTLTSGPRRTIFDGRRTVRARLPNKLTFVCKTANPGRSCFSTPPRGPSMPPKSLTLAGLCTKIGHKCVSLPEKPHLRGAFSPELPHRRLSAPRICAEKCL